MKNPFSPTEHAAWGGFIETQGRLFARIEEHLRGEFGLSHSEFEVLLRLNFAPDGLRLQDLVARSLLSQSGTSRAVNRLVKAGLVKRREAREDGRGAYAALTAAGRKQFLAVAKAHAALVREEFLSRFTEDELTTLAGFWARLREQQ